MSALGRISGPLLKSNLIRNGIDLSFETDLLYLDVNNQKVGIKTTAPTHELQVNGTAQTTNLIVDNIADIANVTIQGSTISSNQPYLNLGTFDNIVYQNKLRVDDIDIEGNVISTNTSSSNLELRPNGTGTVEVLSDMNVDGNIHATGNISADGNITIGDADTDNVVFNAEVASNIIPDLNNTYSLGSDPATGGKKWADVWVNNLNASNVIADDIQVDGLDLTLRQGNIWYVAENGDNTRSGDHIQAPVASLKYALDNLATPGDTVFIFPGIFTEEFPLTVPQGVAVKGQGIRSVNIKPTTATRYNDAFLLNGESTIEDLTISDYYSGGAFHNTTAASAGSATLNVGTAPFAHTYVIGGTITFGGNDYTITNAVYTHGTGELVITHTGPDAGVGTSTFIKDIVFSCNGGNRTFPDNGYAFRFATDFEVTSRSPYIKNITAITKGSVTTAEDPRGFNAGDAGKGPYVDGAYATANSKEASMLFHSCTFITPGVDGLTATNGARIEWLNSFTYFANRGLNAFDSNDGLKGTGKTRVRVSGVSGGTIVASGQNVVFTSTDSSTVITKQLVAVEGNNDVLVFAGKQTDFIGFDTTPTSIAIGGSITATTIENVDLQDFGAEVRMIGSASVYGNEGLVGNGEGVLVYAIGHNLAYIGNGKEITNDPGTVIQANEVVESNGAKIRYNSVDHKGDFRVGDLFKVDQENGTVDFAVSEFTINTTDGVTFNTDGNSTFIDGNKIETGNWRISGNTIETLSGDGNFTAQSNQINLNSNVNVTGNLDVTGNVTIGGNLTLGDDATDTISIVAGITSNLVPDITDTFSLGTASKVWSNLFVTEAQINDIEIRDNFITTTSTQADLELRASGTGKVLVPNNNVQIDNDLTVDGTTTLANATIVGAINHTGDTTQTGDYNLTGTATISQSLTVGASAQFEEILIDDNFITTTSTQADLELRASGTGKIFVPNNDVEIDNDLTVNGLVTTVDIISTGVITADSFTNNVILIDNNVIETTTTDTDLVLNANGTGKINIPSTDVEITQDLTVSGLSTLGNTNITGTLTHVGNTTQTGDFVQIGGLGVTGNFTVTQSAQFEEILIDDNFITTTSTQADLELRASGTGEVLIPNNNVVITGSAEIIGTLTVANLNSTNTITASSFSTGQINVFDNVIETIANNDNLVLQANGTGIISIPTNDVVIDNDLTVNGLTTLGDTTIVGTVTHTGNTTQTGDISLTGDLNVVGDFDVSGAFQFENILIDDNVITTTDTSSDLELRGNGTGSILVPNNNVVVTNNLTVDGTLTVGDVVSVGTITSNNFTTGDILVDDNFVRTTVTNSNLELIANGTGSIVLENFTLESNQITVSTADLQIDSGNNSVVFDGTGEVVIPAGTTAQRTDTTGSIRWNSDNNIFEGYNGTRWIQLHGVQDLDGDTKITAELTEGANDDTIRFTVAGAVVADLDANRLNVQKLVVDDIQVDGNLISTITADTDLQLSANGTGSVNFENFGFKDNRLINTVADSNMVFETQGDGYYEFVDPYGIVLPVGDNSTRPGGVTGMVRYNTADARVELYDGTSWVSVAGSSGGISFADAENIAIEKVLIFG